MPEKPPANESNEVKESLEIVHEMINERIDQDREKELNKKAEAAESRDKESIEKMRGVIEDSREEIVAKETSYREDLYGAFASEDREDGKIILKPDAASALQEAANGFRGRAKKLSNIAVGERIAADYETRTNNFRSQTDLVELPDGRKAYLLYDYPGSWLHRGLDSLMKKLNKIPMGKVGRGKMKERHARMSPIPQIENGDPYMVAMPAIPNANAKDVFAHSRTIQKKEGESEEAHQKRQIGDFNACDDWAGEAGVEEKLELADKIVDEMRRFHASEEGRRGWGEATLSNIIFTEDQAPVMCDFEIKYKDAVSDIEAQARDLKDMCMSVAAALNEAHQQDVTEVVHRMLRQYRNTEVVEELKRVAAKRRGILQNIAFGYEQARTGVSGKKQYDEIRQAITAFEG